MTNQHKSLNCPTCTSPMEVQTDSFGHRTAICPACGTTLDLGSGQPKRQAPVQPKSSFPQGKPQVVQVNIPATSWDSMGTPHKSSSGGCGCLSSILIFGVIGVIIFGIIAAVTISGSGSIEQAWEDAQNSIAGVFSPPEHLTSPSEVYFYSNNMSSVVYSPNDDWLVAGTDEGEVIIWDTVEKVEINRWQIDRFWDIETLDVDASGTFLAVGDSSDIFVYNVSDPKNERLVWSKQNVGSVYDAKFTSDGLYLVTAHSQDGVKVWNAITGAAVRDMNSNGYARHIDVSADGKLVATVYPSDGLRVWDIETGELEQNIKFAGLSDYGIEFSSDGDWLAVIASDEIYLFDTDSWKREKILRSSENVFSPRGLAFSPNGKYLAATDFFGSGVVWEVDSGQIEVFIDHVESSERLTFAPDGTQLAVIGGYHNDVTQTGLGNQIRIWDVIDADEDKDDSNISVTPTPSVTP